MSQTLLTFTPPSLEIEISRNLFSVGTTEIRLPEAKIVLKGRLENWHFYSLSLLFLLAVRPYTPSPMVSCSHLFSKGDLGSLPVPESCRLAGLMRSELKYGGGGGGGASGAAALPPPICL